MYRKYTYQEKLNIVEGYLNGIFSLEEVAESVRPSQYDCRQEYNI